MDGLGWVPRWVLGALLSIFQCLIFGKIRSSCITNIFSSQMLEVSSGVLGSVSPALKTYVSTSVARKEGAWDTNADFPDHEQGAVWKSRQISNSSPLGRISRYLAAKPLLSLPVRLPHPCASSVCLSQPLSWLPLALSSSSARHFCCCDQLHLLLYFPTTASKYEVQRHRHISLRTQSSTLVFLLLLALCHPPSPIRCS